MASRLRDRFDTFCQKMTDMCRRFNLLIDVHGCHDENKVSPIVFYLDDGSKRLSLKDLMATPKGKEAFLSELGTLFAELNMIVDRGKFEEGYPMVIRDRKWRKQLCYLSYDFEGEEEEIVYVWSKEPY